MTSVWKKVRNKRIEPHGLCHLSYFQFLFETKITEEPSDGSWAFGGNENSRLYANLVSGSFEPAVYGALLKTAICFG